MQQKATYSGLVSGLDKEHKKIEHDQSGSVLKNFPGVLRKADLKGHRLIDTVMNVRDNNCPFILECNTLSESESHSADNEYIETTQDDF